MLSKVEGVTKIVNCWVEEGGSISVEENLWVYCVHVIFVVAVTLHGCSVSHSTYLAQKDALAECIITLQEPYIIR